MKKYLIPAIGVGAFILGGLVTRAKTLDAVEVLQDKYIKKTPENIEQ
jgi:hypothetical protein